MNNEPVAWYYENKNGVSWVSGTREKHDKNFVAVEKPIYTHLANLTDEEIEKLWFENVKPSFTLIQIKDFARAILRKAQEK